MARLVSLEEGPSEDHGRESTLEAASLPAWQGERHLSGISQGIEVFLTTKEASQVLKIHPKVLERMAKRGEVPALKVGKFWRYRAVSRNNAGRLDQFKTTIRPPTVPHGNLILNGGDMQARYQYGNLTLRKRAKGPDVWQFRWMENGKPKSVLIGTVDRYPNQADAERAVEQLPIKINAESPQQQFHRVTIEGLVERYKAEELPARYSTRASHLSYLKNHIVPRWGVTHAENVRALDVENWLRSLSLAPKTKAHIRSLMHVLFQCARRWELTQVNPIEFVRQSARRRTIPRILTPDEFYALLAGLREPYRSMVLVGACLGLRASEVVGLQWRDLD